MSCNGTSSCTCGCCSGISVQTPVGENNLPGLSSIAYRTGTWATFKQSMLARVATPEERASLWPRVTAAYSGYAGYQKKTDREIPLVLLEPVEGAPS